MWWSKLHVNLKIIYDGNIAFSVFFLCQGWKINTKWHVRLRIRFSHRQKWFQGPWAFSNVEKNSFIFWWYTENCTLVKKIHSVIFSWPVNPKSNLVLTYVLKQVQIRLKPLKITPVRYKTNYGQLKTDQNSEKNEFL